MSILNDRQIRDRVKDERMIDEFVDHQVKEVDGRRVISYGLSSFGYDMRCADEFQIFTPSTAV